MRGKRLLSLMLSLALALFAFTLYPPAGPEGILQPGSAAADTAERTVILVIGSPTMFVNGVSQEIDPGYKTAPVIVNGRTCLPIRALIGDAGTVNWDATLRKVDIQLGSKSVVLYIGNTVATVNGVSKTMDVAPFISSTGRTMLPLRFIIENLDMTVDWFAATRTVVVHMGSGSTTAGAITVSQPSSGASWQVGSSHTISWTYTGVTGTVDIDLLEGSSVAVTIASNASVGSGGYGSYSWTPSSSLDEGSDYRVRVKSDSNASVLGTSSYFSITSDDDDGSITVTTPTSSSEWDAGSTHTIYWNYSGLSSSGTVAIELYKDGDYDSNIKSSASIGSSGSGSYSWTIDDDQDEDDNYQVRVTSNSDDDVYDDSSDFSITSDDDDDAYITVTSPISSSEWAAGSTHSITWSYSGLDSSSTVTIDLYRDGDYDSSIVEDRDIGSSGSGSYSWAIDDAQDEGDDYEVRVTSDDDDDVYDDSIDFTITGSEPSINVTAPASGASWKVGTSYTIKWTYTNLDSSSTVDIELYKGSTFVDTIISDRDIGSGSSGSYTWTPGSDLEAATNYKIGVTSDDDSSVNDYSSSFTITVPTPTIKVTAPASGASWAAGSTHSIKWTYTNLDSDGTVDIELYKGSDYEDTIVSGRDIGSSGSGSYSWAIDDDLDAATNYKIKISSNDTTCTVTSSSFKIT